MDYSGAIGRAWSDKFSDSVEANTKRKDTQAGDIASEESAFLTEEDLDMIWDSNKELGELLLGKTGLAGVALEDFLASSKKIVSILITICWNRWPEFGPIFWRHKDSNGNLDRADKDMPFGQDKMRDDDFLRRNYADLFAQNQYKFIPMHFEEGEDYNVLPAMRFPFINQAFEQRGEGATAVVTREVVACRHLINSEGQNQDPRPIACKRFKTADQFESEKENMLILRHAVATHDRIILSLASIKRGETFYILYPLASNDLYQFLYQPPLGKVDIIDLIHEAANVALALDFLHTQIYLPARRNADRFGYLACCHMDLKPENILIFDTQQTKFPVGKWKISDFGISTFKQIHPRRPEASTRLNLPCVQNQETSLTRPKRYQGTYQAPEVNEPGVKKEVGRKSDMWSLGCVLIQILAFGLGGERGLRTLDEKRTKGLGYFCTKIAAGNVSEWQLHPDISTFIEELTTHNTQQHDIGTSFDFEGLQQLLRKLLNTMVPDERPDAKAVAEALYNTVHSTNKTIDLFSFQHSSRTRGNGAVSSSLLGSSFHGQRDRLKGKRREPVVTKSEEDLAKSNEGLPSKAVQDPITFERPASSEETGLSPSRPIFPSPPVSLLGPQSSFGPSSHYAVPIDAATLHSPGAGYIHLVNPPVTSNSPPERRNHRLSTPSGSLRDGRQLSLPRAPSTPGTSLASNSSTNPKESARIWDLSPTRSEMGKGPKTVHLCPLGKTLVLLTEQKACVYSLTDERPRFVCNILPPADFKELHSVCLAGDYLCLHVIVKKKEEIYLPYHISGDSQISQLTCWQPGLGSLRISTKGALLCESLGQHGQPDEIKHFRQANSTSVTLSAHDPPLGEVLRFFYGTSGRWAFVTSQNTKAQAQYVHTWDTEGAERYEALTFTHSFASNDTQRIESIIPLPKSRGYVLWAKDDMISIVRTQRDASDLSNAKKISSLLALAVSPDENFLALLVKKTALPLKKTYHEVLVYKITTKIDALYEKHHLTHQYEPSKRSDFGCRATSTGFVIVVAHATGKIEEIPISSF